MAFEILIKCRAQAYERAKRALRTSLGREAANAEVVYTQPFISERRMDGGP